jgi:hypothetical protein
MSRPEGAIAKTAPCCARLAGESPAAASAGALRSRPRAGGEIPSSERGVKSPRGVVRPHAEGSKATGPMRKRESLQPRDINNRKGGAAEPIMSRRRQQTAPRRTAWIPVTACGDRVEVVEAGDGRRTLPGYEGRARGDSPARNRRGPPRRPTSGEGGAHKPTAKGCRAGRESEELIVPLRVGTKTPPEGRGSALVVPGWG